MVEENYTLSNGVQIPAIGFGTWQLAGDGEAYQAVSHALSSGYRHIDTAEAYNNEDSVGRAIQDSTVAREDIFLTTKIWNDKTTYEETLAGVEASLDRLQTDYVDLLLIHWPNPKDVRGGIGFEERNKEVWRAMETLYSDGKARAIGVSNFLPYHLNALLEIAEVKPMVNQVLLAPGTPQSEVVRASRKHDLLMEAYSPLGSGNIFTNEQMLAIAEEYDRSVAQIALRWSIEKGFLPLPRSSNPTNIESNLKIFDFELSEETIAQIDSIEPFIATPKPDEKDF